MGEYERLKAQKEMIVAKQEKPLTMVHEMTVAELLKKVTILNDMIKDGTERLIAASRKGEMKEVKSRIAFLAETNKSLDELLSKKISFHEDTE